jgi:hypothetical protein
MIAMVTTSTQAVRRPRKGPQFDSRHGQVKMAFSGSFCPKIDVQPHDYRRRAPGR